MNINACIATFALSLLAATSALASEGYVTNNVNLRAGPDRSYPSVARLREGTQVSIEGCVDGWTWCDVSDDRDNRGWVSGTYLREEYEGRRVLLRDYGVQIGIPVLRFDFGTYWGDHYRNRSWYGKREHWSHIRPQYRVDQPARGDRHEDSHNHVHGDARSTVRTGDQSGHSLVHSDRPSYEVRPANAVAQPQPVARPNRHSPRADDHTSSGRIDSGQRGSVTAQPVAHAQPARRVQPQQQQVQPQQSVQQPQRVQPTQPAQPRIVAEHATPATRAPKNDVPAKAAHEHDKDNAKDDAEARGHD